MQFISGLVQFLVLGNASDILCKSNLLERERKVNLLLCHSHLKCIWWNLEGTFGVPERDYGVPGRHLGVQTRE